MKSISLSACVFIKSFISFKLQYKTGLEFYRYNQKSQVLTWNVAIYIGIVLL